MDPADRRRRRVSRGPNAPHRSCADRSRARGAWRSDGIAGLIKGTIFGIIIAIAGCLRGVQCSKSAAAVGEVASSAVVTSIVFMVIAQATQSGCAITATITMSASF